MPVTVTDGKITVTLNIKALSLTQRWRQKGFPLYNKPPLVVDLGLEEHLVEITVTVSDRTTFDDIMRLVNPINVKSSTIPELPVGSYWRIAERNVERKPGWTSYWEIRLRLRRDYQAEGAI